MGNWEAALFAMIGISSIGFFLAEGEKKRLKWILAMRRCLVRLIDAVRYEQPGRGEWLANADWRGSQQERELSRLLRACGKQLQASPDTPLASTFVKESAKASSYGVLSQEDRQPFEKLLAELGYCSLREQLRLIESADEQLRCREELLRRQGTQRARMIASLGVCCGAGVFLLLI